MKNLTLVVMAAGMGSRFGGPKQITPIGPSGEFILDYSIYDAIKAGFTKIVLIIRKEHQEVFKDTVEKRVNGRIKIEYAYQELDTITDIGNVPLDRTKPLGTAHAVLCAKNLVNEPFAIINADDFYGRDAYLKVANFLNNSEDEQEGTMISYPFVVTSSKYGSVKRGVINLDGDYVSKITESSVSIDGEHAICKPLDGSPEFTIELNHPVSMNLFGFKQKFMNSLEQDFQKFVRQDSETLKTAEALLPDTAKRNIENGTLKLKNIVSEGMWAGMTYKEDLDELKDKINNLISNKEYPSNLWDN